MPPYFYETGFFVSQQGERKQKLREIGSKVYTIFFEEPTKYGFEIREGQQEMACEIVYAITGGSHLAVEAGVGIGKSYSYFIGSTGFPVEDGASLSEPKPSPFPYNEHATIYYCDDLPHPTREHEEFIKQETARLIDILNISKGKALVLFTAKTDMEEVYAALQSQKLPYKILMQQAGSSQENVLQEFEENTDSVLLGTGAYWEGISIEGKSLSNLVIFRLPFPVPDPIISYKESVSSNALMKVMVPEMVTKLKQGVGRLIRNFTDTEIISKYRPTTEGY